VKPVDRIVPDFARAGARIISFHPEASEHIDRTLSLIRDEGCKAGLVFNPATPLVYLDHVMDKVDLILIMSVNPGFGGQSFIERALAKVAEVRALLDARNPACEIEVDGGIGLENAERAVRAGANVLVAGNSVFGADDPPEALRELRRRVDAAQTSAR